jgi:microsomal dipeptidase-like Zn-dependent dipeptidase
MKPYIHHIANVSFFKVTKSANNLTFKLKKNQPCRNKIKVYTENSCNCSLIIQKRRIKYNGGAIMSVLVTGGAGYIGSHACVELLEAGFEVVVVDNLSNSKEESLNRVQEITGKSLKFYRVDLLDKEKLDDIFKKESINAVMHFAGLKAVGESVSIPYKYYHNNITGTLNLCDIMIKHGVKDSGFQLFRHSIR